MTRKILAIDDSLTLREFIHRCLSRHSAEYQIVLAKDGGEGLALAAGERPDLILLDFVLPDMKGDEVCRRLRGNEETARMPVVLMSSSAADIKRTQAEFDNVVKAIAKPFTPELLCATVGYALREATRTRGTTPAVSNPANVPANATQAKVDASNPASSHVCLTGHTGQFSIADVLTALEQDQLTGVLRVFVTPKPVELYVAAGRPMLVTSREPQAYAYAVPQTLNAEQLSVLDVCQKSQADTGCPIFISLAELKAMSIGDAATLLHETGLRFFASTWTAPRARFEFESGTPLPPLTAGLQPYDGGMSDWAMESLRHVGDEYLSAMAWGEPTGIPAYTRRGYERIQQIPLNDEELIFAGLIGPNNSLAAIAHAMQLSIEATQRILHRFLCLGIFDYWPASLLQTSEASAA